MLGAMTSLTGGGGLSASSSASSATGDQANDAAFNVGSLNFGNNSREIGGRDLLFGGIAVVVVLLFLKSTKRRM